MEESPSSCQAQGGSAQVSQSEVELVEEPVGVVVHKPVWYRAICQRVFHDVGDERGESVLATASRTEGGWWVKEGARWMGPLPGRKCVVGIWVVEADAGVLCTAGCGVKRWLLVMTGSDSTAAARRTNSEDSHPELADDQLLGSYFE